MQKFNIILATDKNGGIGYNNKLPWNFNLDKKYFHNKITVNSIFPLINKNILIMGYKSFIEFNKNKLENIIIYVIARDVEILNSSNSNKDIVYLNSFQEAIEKSIEQAKEFYSDIWVLGGKKIYEEALIHPLCDKIYLTLINATFNSDINISLSEYNIKWSKEISKTDLNYNDKLTYELLFKEGELLNNKAKYSINEKFPVEILQFYTKPEYVEEFIKVDYDIWTLKEAIDNNIAAYPFYAKEVWLNEQNPGEITIIHIWKSLELWKMLDQKEFQKKCIKEFNNKFKYPYRLLTNVHDQSFWSKYRYSRYEVTD
jgi:uncharacterized protein (TIGR03792 family)